MMRAGSAFFAAALLALPMLGGCADFDAEKLDFFNLNAEKKLPGERKALFPEGVPGVAQGIPPDLVKGAKPPETAAATMVEPEPEKPKPEPKPRVVRRAPKPAPTPPPPAQAAPAQQPATPPPQQAQKQPAPAWPDPKPAPQQAGTQSPWPEPQRQTSPWPDAPPPNTFQR